MNIVLIFPHKTSYSPSVSDATHTLPVKCLNSYCEYAICFCINMTKRSYYEKRRMDAVKWLKYSLTRHTSRLRKHERMFSGLLLLIQYWKVSGNTQLQNVIENACYFFISDIDRPLTLNNIKLTHSV